MIGQNKVEMLPMLERLQNYNPSNPIELMEKSAQIGLDKFNLEPNTENFYLLMDRFFPLPSAYAPKDNSETWLKAIETVGDKVLDVVKTVTRVEAEL